MVDGGFISEATFTLKMNQLGADSTITFGAAPPIPADSTQYTIPLSTTNDDEEPMWAVPQSALYFSTANMFTQTDSVNAILDSGNESIMMPDE